MSQRSRFVPTQDTLVQLSIEWMEGWIHPQRHIRVQKYNKSDPGPPDRQPYLFSVVYGKTTGSTIIGPLGVLLYVHIMASRQSVIDWRVKAQSIQDTRATIHLA